MVYDVIFPYVVGGVQLRNWELAKRLSGRGHEVTLFGMKHWPGPAIIEREGVRLHGVCSPRELYRNGRRAFLPPIYTGLRTLAPLLRERYDLIDVANFPYFPFFSAKIATLTQRSRLVVTWIEVWGSYWQEYLGKAGLVARAIEKVCANGTTNAVAISDMTKRDLRRIGYRGPVEVIGCGVDVAGVTSVGASAAASDVVFFGRLIKEKNADLLIRAIALLAKDLPEVRCLIVGDGPARDGLVSLIHDADLQRQVRVVPFVRDHAEVFATMKASKVLVLPSSREGFGITALEANACGLPVITTRYPRNACCDLIRDGENGFVCEPSDGEVAERIRQVLVGAGPSPSDCARSAARYDWDALATAVERYYQRVGTRA